jgi:small ligand-binding sensory domain FIST
MGILVGVSDHPHPAAATGEAVGQVIERLGFGEAPSLFSTVFVLLSGAHAASADAIGASVTRMLGCGATVVTAPRVEVGGSRSSVTETPDRIVVWAVLGSDIGADIGADMGAEGDGEPRNAEIWLGAAGDPLFDRAGVDRAGPAPGQGAVGGLSAGSTHPGSIVVGGPGPDRVTIPRVRPVWAPGWIAFGPDMRVTSAMGRVVHTLDHDSPMSWLERSAPMLSPDDRVHLATGLLLLPDARVVGARAGSGALALDRSVAIDDSVRFAALDHDRFADHIATAFADADVTGFGALVFCHDTLDLRVAVSTVHDIIDGPVAGLSCATVIHAGRPRRFGAAIAVVS